MRLHVLTRLKNLEGAWEFTRYSAEANAVCTINSPKLIERCPPPSDGDYPVKEEGEAIEEATPKKAVDPKKEREPERPVVQSKPTSMHEAVGALRARRYDAAIEFFEQIVRTKPDYHIAWQRLGLAQRERAVELMDNERERAADLLHTALKSFSQASKHVAWEPRAEAHYHASKTHYRLWQLLGDDGELKAAIREGELAAKIFPDGKFISWLEFMATSSGSWSEQPS